MNEGKSSQPPLFAYDGDVMRRSYRSERLPANLIQAQRDFFGAHTYERTDKPGVFHTEWSPSQPSHEAPRHAPVGPAKVV